MQKEVGFKHFQVRIETHDVVDANVTHKLFKF
jgi:hypothetical protein